MHKSMGYVLATDLSCAAHIENTETTGMIIRNATGLFCILLLSHQVANGQELDQLKELSMDHSKVMGYETCSKCHANEVRVWQNTPHAETFRSLHRKPEAKAICKKMGQRSIKRGDLCVDCHYTQQSKGSSARAVSGVSCESCHGAAKDWFAIHNDYGGPTATKQSESAAHRDERRKESIKKGMRNPSNLYLIARSCMNCHTVPNEKLVNVGGHQAGSLDFELVAWSQGIVRHNFMKTDGQSNSLSSPDRLRVMYVVGLMADLEYSLRATSLSTERAQYAFTNALRADRLRKKLTQMQSEIRNDFLQQACDAANDVKLRSNNNENIAAAAELVGAAAFSFASQTDGNSLGAVDPYLPQPDQYK